LKVGYLLRQLLLGITARSSAAYWERRYRWGLNSGSGSTGELARHKAEFLNGFVRRHAVTSVAEFGCGDGNQLALADYPRYLGLDVSRTAIRLCVDRFERDPTKSFLWYDPGSTVNLAGFVRADLSLSLDVIYHLFEDHTYRQYLADLFATAIRFVIIYSSDSDEATASPHVRHRRFTADVAAMFPDFEKVQRVPNLYPERTFAEFAVYRRRTS